MSRTDTDRAGALRRTTPTLFLVAGGLFVVFAGLLGAATFSDFSARTAETVVGPAGWTAAFVGLLGLYRGVAARTPWLARAGAVCAAVGVAGAVVTAAANLGQLAGVVGEPPTWFAALNLLIFVGIIPGFLAAAAATLRTGTHSRTLGLLLAVPAALFVVNVVRVAVVGPRVPTGAPFVLASGQAVALLSIGVALRTADVPTDRAGASGDPTP